VRKEFEGQGIAFSLVEAEFSMPQSPMERLHRHLAQTKDNTFWQPLLIAITNRFIELIWQTLHEIDRKKFLENHHHIFMSICNPMPPKTAEVLRELIEDGRVVIAADVKNIKPDVTRGFIVSAGGRHFHADKIVNASRPENGGIGQLGTPVVDALVGAGEAQLNPYGGVKVDPVTLNILRRNGKPNPNLFAIGQLAAGDLYYTSSLIMITQQVERMVPHLLALTRNRVQA